MSDTKRNKSRRTSSHRNFRDNPFVELVSKPTFWPIDFYEWTIAWIYTRRWLAMLACLPVLGLLSCIAMASVLGAAIKPSVLATRYLALARIAEDDQDEVSLDFCYRKLLDMQLPEKTRFEIALFLYGNGQTAQAKAEMNRLAPYKSDGFAQAHLWLVEDARRQKTPFTRENLDIRQHHAEVAFQQFSDNVTALTELADIWQLSGDMELAVGLLDKATVKQPQLHFRVALGYRALGNRDQFEEHRNKAEEHFRSQLALAPKNQEARELLVRSVMLADKFDDAIAIAEVGYRSTASEAMRSLFLDSCTFKYDHLSIEAKSRFEGTSLLKKCLAIDPKHPNTLERIAVLLGEVPSADAGLSDHLQRLLDSDEAPCTIHKLIAAGHLKREEYDLAIIQLEKALVCEPRLVEVLNNLAWCYAVNPSPNIERAWSLVMEASKLAPLNREVRETRGVILIKQGNYSAAIVDLEPLLTAFPNRAYLRTWIANAYDKLGDATMSERFKKEAESLDRQAR